MIAEPNHASPFGCVIGLFGLMALTISGYCWISYFKVAKIEDLEKAESYQAFLFKLGAGTLVVGLVIIVLSWKMIRGADLSSPRDPDKPTLRF